MGRHANIDLDRKALKRIVALLLAFAALADLAAARPLAVRLVLFCILRRAHAVARTLLVGPSGRLEAPALPTRREIAVGCGRFDLVGLAAAFRVMAAMLARFATLGAPIPASPAGPCARLPLSAYGPAPARVDDTS